MGKVIDASDATFDEITKTGWVLVDFWAPWCGPCKMVAPILEQIANEREITIAKVNTDENRNTPGRFGVRGIPTLVLFNEGQVADQRTGASTKPNLDAWLDTHMN
ncbi:MAG: thioredoxin [Euryarchaeota archaeon]|nr:thioredoxin [Euryarchaeota archaeon]|tara:strand:+ start:1762 stop:2076 length:315 start_codon:yes stop_codon:yes gene_type:complete